MLCAFKPEAPVAPISTNLNEKIVIEWSEPVKNGSPITGYKIYIIQHSSNAFIQESVYCNGLSDYVIANRVCIVPLLTLYSPPYNLEQGESVQVKIIGINFYGDSPQSLAGNGALIWVVPDAPIYIANEISTTNANHIKFTWT